MSNHVDRFYAALSVVAGYGDIKQRLISAFETHLDTIDDEELPADVSRKFVTLRNLMTGVQPSNGEGRIRATVRKMSVYEADSCARRILDIYTVLVRRNDESERPDAIDVDLRTAVPPFLVKSALS